MPAAKFTRLMAYPRVLGQQAQRLCCLPKGILTLTNSFSSQTSVKLPANLRKANSLTMTGDKSYVDQVLPARCLLRWSFAGAACNMRAWTACAGARGEHALELSVIVQAKDAIGQAQGKATDVYNQAKDTVMGKASLLHSPSQVCYVAGTSANSAC